jgi:hypothetical protein
MTNSDIQERIGRLLIFRDNLDKYFHCTDDHQRQELRRAINLGRAFAEREAIEAGRMQLLTIGPPPATGGLIIKNANPFDMLFEPPYGMSVIPSVIDMIDSAIGAMESSSYYEVTSRSGKGMMSSEIQEGYVFIAMPMDPTDGKLEDVHDAIKEACGRCGLLAERIDEAQANERITDRILESILRAQYVVVDLTNARPNVFYEAGFAQGNGKTPIYIARAGTPLEFDLKDYPVIYFENNRQLKTKLEERLRALATRGG